MFEHNRLFLLELIKTNGKNYKNLIHLYENDIEFLLEANKTFPKSLYYASNKLKNNKDLMFKLITNNGKNYRYLLDKFKEDETFILEAIKTYPRSLYYLSKTNKSFIIKLIKKDVNNYNYIPDIYKKDEDIIIEAINKTPKFLYYESDILKNINEIIIMKIFKIYITNNEYHKYILDIFNNYINIIIKILPSYDYSTIYNIIKFFNNNNNFNKKLYETHYDIYITFYKFIENKDKNIVSELLIQKKKYIDYEILLNMYSHFKNDKEIILKLLKKTFFDVNTLYEIYYNFQNDKEIILALLEINNYHNFNFKLKMSIDNINIILKYVEKNGIKYINIPEIFKENIDILLESIKTYPLAILHTSINIKNDKNNIIKIFNCINANKLLKRKYKILKYLSNELRNDEEIVYLSIINNIHNFKYANKELQNNKDFILKIIKYNGLVLQYASKKIKNDKEIVLEAFKNNKYSLNYASKKLKYNKQFLIDYYKNYDIYLYLYYYNLKCSNYIKDIHNLYNNNLNDDLIKRNINILYLFDNALDYLLINKKYNIIYNNEHLSEYFKKYKNIIFLSINDLNIDNKYNINELKIEYQKQFKDFHLIFF
jgi:hypothetical protein